jgi:hypothetical protein
MLQIPLYTTQNYEVCSISQVPWFIKEKLEATAILRATYLFQWSVVILHCHPQANCCICPISRGVYKFSRGANTVTSIGAVHVKPLLLTLHCETCHDWTPASMCPRIILINNMLQRNKCISVFFSTNIRTEFFKHAAHSLRFLLFIFWFFLSVKVLWAYLFWFL